MSLTKLSLGGNIPAQGEFSQWHPGWGRENRLNFFTVYIIVLPEYAYNVSPFTVFSNAVYVYRVFDGEYNGSFFNICDSSFTLQEIYVHVYNPDIWVQPVFWK
jgi:hypothetical protein